MYRGFIKPVLDRLTAAMLLLAAMPVLLPVCAALAVTNDGRVWFRQPRPGKGGRIFNIVKFKTMSDARDKNGKLLPDEERLTRVGRWIRRTSLDELPQLFNVILGEMSIVGPRPLLVEYLPLYDSEQCRRHEVSPGITGWAQVNGRNTLTWQEKFVLDVWYVDHLSFLLDLRILLLTIYKVLKSEGISSRTSATMEPFTGNE